MDKDTRDKADMTLRALRKIIAEYCASEAIEDGHLQHGIDDLAQTITRQAARIAELEVEHEISEFVELILEQGIQLASPLATSTLKFAATVERVRENMEIEARNDTGDLVYLEEYGLLSSRKITKKLMESEALFDGAEVGETMWEETYLGHMLNEIVGDYLHNQAVKYYARAALKAEPS